MTRAFLFAWNPRKWPWEGLDHDLRALRRTGKVSMRWTSGNRRELPIGSRIYLVRLGVPPKGIIAAGISTSKPKMGIHWDASRRRAGRAALGITADFHVLTREPLVSLGQLSRARPFSSFQWVQQSSGVEIPSRIISALDELIPFPAGPGFPGGRALLDRILATTQGFESDPRVRKAIEVAAVGRARRHYERKGFRVRERGKPFDLECRKGPLELFVEVKGSRTEGATIMLTPNEVEFAHRNRMELFLVHSMKVTGTRRIVVRGGKKHVVPNWRPDRRKLTPVTYSYEILRS